LQIADFRTDRDNETEKGIDRVSRGPWREGPEAMAAGTLRLARRMAVSGGVSLSQAVEIVGVVTGVIRAAVAGGECVRIYGLGRFERRELKGWKWDPKRERRVRRAVKARVWFRGKGLQIADCRLQEDAGDGEA
jgi:nucleoid DNA-binding protein